MIHFLRVGEAVTQLLRIVFLFLPCSFRRVSLGRYECISHFHPCLRLHCRWMLASTQFISLRTQSLSSFMRSADWCINDAIPNGMYQTWICKSTALSELSIFQSFLLLCWPMAQLRTSRVRAGLHQNANVELMSLVSCYSSYVRNVCLVKSSFHVELISTCITLDRLGTLEGNICWKILGFKL